MAGTGQGALSLAVALAAAAAFGLASALQHAESGKAERRGPLDPALLQALSRRPLWLLGIVADVVAVGLQAVALRYGPVTLVQPVLVAGLPCAVLLSGAFEHRRPSRSELLGVLACTLGLAVLTPALSAGGAGAPPRRAAGVAAALVLVLITAGLLLLARLRPRFAAVALGAAAGVSIGTGSVLLAVCAARAGHPGALFSSLAPYAAVVAGLSGLALSQAAFQTGALGAPLATLSIVEPALAVVLAVTVLHEPLSGSTRAAVLAVIGAGLCVAGVLVLAGTARAGAPTLRPR